MYFNMLFCHHMLKKKLMCIDFIFSFESLLVFIKLFINNVIHIKIKLKTMPSNVCSIFQPTC